MLTGESTPANKQAGVLRGHKEAYEQANMLFGGSFVLAGECRAMVVATGNATEFGRIAGLVQGDGLTSPVQVKIDRLVTQIIGATAIISAVVFALLGPPHCCG
jgi:magnesium-transporting ATPase (P-type)